ncbi:GNAT family acetyltransferase [Georgenia halophila]|uniref:GNAT family acetyltransferase n=1 Tax=Georgenia halophila TaxID=620889 RepID=A0ABP8KXJ9_9MICO
MARHGAAAPEIGELRDGEADAVVALWQECGLTRPWNDPHADIAQARRVPTSTVLVARRNDRVVGSVVAGLDGHRGWVYYLAVVESERGRGLGTELLCHAEQWLTDTGARKVQLMVRDGNPVAGFYEERGYETQHVTVLGRWLV